MTIKSPSFDDFVFGSVEDIHALPTSDIVRLAVRAEILIAQDPVTARAPTKTKFRVALSAIHTELNSRIPRSRI